MEIKTPLVIVFEDETSDKINFRLHPSERCNTYQAYGLLACDLVRHIAQLFQVNEKQVWEWVDKERAKPTTSIDVIQRPKSN